MPSPLGRTGRETQDDVRQIAPRFAGMQPIGVTPSLRQTGARRVGGAFAHILRAARVTFATSILRREPVAETVISTHI